MTDSAAVRFYASPQTCSRLADARLPKVILIGSFSGSWNFGDILQLQGTLRWQRSRQQGQMLCPLHVLSMAPSAEYIEHLAGVFATSDWLFSWPETSGDCPQAAALGLQLVTTAIAGPSTLHVYGGGFFNSRWGADMVGRIECMLDLLTPQHYIISGQQIEAAFAPALAAHCRRYHPDAIGCRDQESVDMLRALGLDAQLSGDDAFEELAEAAAVPSHTTDSSPSHPTVALYLNSSDYVTDPPAAGPPPLDAIGNSVQLVMRRSGAQAVLIRAYRDPRPHIQDTLATLRKTSAGSRLKVSDEVDLVDTVERGCLSEAAALLRRCALAVSTSYHVTMFLKVLGVPAYFLIFNDYYRQKKQGLGDALVSLDEWIGDGSVPPAADTAFVARQSAIRAAWLEQLDAQLVAAPRAEKVQARAVAAQEHTQQAEAERLRRQQAAQVDGVAASMKRALQRHGWLLALLACLMLSYLVIWQRGFYVDDYTFYRQTIDPTSGQQYIYLRLRLDRPLAFLADINLAGLALRHELPVRALAALVSGANALLLGWLVYRLTRARLMAVLVVWLFASPFMAHEAVLWIAAYLYIFSAFFVLLCLHAAATAFLRRRRWQVWALVSIVCYAAAIGFGEQAALSVVLVPIVGIALAAQGRSIGSFWRRCAPMVLFPGITLSAIAWFGYRTATMVESRGGIDLSSAGLLGRTGQFLDRLVMLTVRPNTGLRLALESGKQGVHALGDSPAAMLVFLVAALCVLVAVVSWQPEHKRPLVGSRGALALAGAGVLWLVAATLVPGILVTGQILVVRMLYIPLAGAAVAGAALAWLIARRLPAAWGERLVVLGAAGVLLASSVCMLGYCRAYQARSRLDQRQLASLSQALPARYVPDGAYVVPLELDERLFGHTDGMSAIVIGVLQARWAAQDVFTDLFQRTHIQTVARLGELSKSVAYRESPAELRITDQPVPLDKTILFVYKDGRCSVIESLVIRQSDGTVRVVHFPIAAQMAADGLPVLKDYVAPQVQEVKQ